ncbi:glycosyltransferase family 4 protein [Bradyrhizobium sp. WSM1743]|uniref:glycosyltransferase family 4 protein n=1 Tax=Bradyrhizobium sp. WSM1743 TaxID=318996 RepID=UPI0004253C07|nr:glycosyltransferase family 4 protein [Bradyrhizobium sp. WSM1743]
MRLAVIAAGNPLDISTWSGTPYFMTKALAQKFPDLVTVRAPRAPWFPFIRRAVRKASSGRIDLEWSHAIAKRDAGRIAQQLKSEGVDIAISIACSPITAYLAQAIATVHVSDATVPLMRDYYQEFSRLPETIAQCALELDRTSVLRARVCLYSTAWAARSAINDYQADPGRIHAVPWGANVEGKNSFSRTVPYDVCHLVFIGVDWNRKGGAIAIAAVEKLAQAGYPVRLHVIGATPPQGQRSEAIIAHGFIGKGTPEGRLKFDEIMRQAAFLFVPTRQDCSPMIFAEANSYGVPVITTQTGGVADVVHEGVNGHLLSADAGPDAYADLIWSIWSERARYEQLRISSRVRFDHALNWKSWLGKVVPILEGLYTKGRMIDAANLKSSDVRI